MERHFDSYSRRLANTRPLPFTADNSLSDAVKVNNQAALDGYQETVHEIL